MGKKKKKQGKKRKPEELVDKITPKGCALSAFYDSNIYVSGGKFREFWKRFMENMTMFGYVHESDIDIE